MHIQEMFYFSRKTCEEKMTAIFRLFMNHNFISGSIIDLEPLFLISGNFFAVSFPSMASEFISIL